MVDIESGKIRDFVKFEVGNLAIVTGGQNGGRVGIVLNTEKHPGSHTIVHMRDAAGNEFATRKDNVFVIGKGNKPLVSLPKAKGVRLSILQEQAARMQRD